MNKKLITLFVSAGLLILPVAIFAQTVPATQGIPINTATPACINLTTNMKMGPTSDPSVKLQILNLQAALTAEGFSIDPTETGTYGKSTAAAIKAFQEKYSQDVLAPFGIKKGTGNVGTNTRLKLMALHGCQASPAAPTTPAASNITANLAVTNMTLDQNGVTATFCNNGADNLPTAPFRIRLNGINRDFEEPGATKANTCITDSWVYASWGLSFDPGATFTAVALIDPNNIYKHGQLQFPLSGTTNTITVPSLNGVNMSVRSVLLKSTGLQATFCNNGTKVLPSFPVQIVLNGASKAFDVSEAYPIGKCVAKTWTYDNWGITYTPGTVYSATITVDPNNVDQDPDKFDNVASVIGVP